MEQGNTPNGNKEVFFIGKKSLIDLKSKFIKDKLQKDLKNNRYILLLGLERIELGIVGEDDMIRSKYFTYTDGKIQLENEETQLPANLFLDKVKEYANDNFAFVCLTDELLEVLKFTVASGVTSVTDFWKKASENILKQSFEYYSNNISEEVFIENILNN